jgi:hypothetical protein
MPLDLSVPARSSAPSKDLEIRPKQVKAWIDSLPLAQTFDSARKLAEHLAGVNRAKIDLEERLQILELHRPIADLLFEELDGIYGKAPQPMGQRGRDALAFARTLAAELAMGYKIVLVEKAGKRVAFGIRKQLPALALRAMQALAAGMRASYKAYAPVPQGIWKEFHHLYLYAEEEGIVAEVADAQAGTTIAALYCESLLLSLTDPYRLLPGDLDKVVGQIRALRAPVTLGRRKPDTPGGAHFLVPCDTDKPPKPALSANDDTGGPNWRLLDANAIVERLRARKQAFESGNVSATMTRAMGPETVALVTRLIGLWGDPPKRVFRRDEAEGSVAICFGVKNIAHFVAHDALADTEAETEALRAGLTMPLRCLPEDETGRQIPIHEWAIINHSEGGIKVRRSAGVTQPLAVGEVVGVKAAGNASWRIGVARWITVFEDGTMEFGVQFYATAACAVWLLAVQSPGPQAKLAVLLADGEELAGESLLTPAGTYAQLREFDLQGEEFRSRVRATDLIEKTARFELFHVSPS